MKDRAMHGSGAEVESSARRVELYKTFDRSQWRECLRLNTSTYREINPATAPAAAT